MKVCKFVRVHDFIKNYEVLRLNDFFKNYKVVKVYDFIKSYGLRENKKSKNKALIRNF